MSTESVVGWGRRIPSLLFNGDSIAGNSQCQASYRFLPFGYDPERGPHENEKKKTGYNFRRTMRQVVQICPALN